MTEIRITYPRDGVAQIEVPGNPSMLLTVAQHPDYGFKGCLITKDDKGNMDLVEFHGDGIDNVIVHGPTPWLERQV